MAITGRVLGVRRIPAIKGQAIPAYDPRSLKGIGVTYAMGAMGGDHTAGNALETAKTVDPQGRTGQVATSLRLQIRGAILDSLGVCLFIRPAFVKDPAADRAPAQRALRLEWTYEDVRAMALECLRAEQEFNTRAGVTDAMCDVPEFMRREPLPPHNTVFDVDREEMRHIWEAQAAGGRILNDKVCMITGAARGLGEAIARQFHEAGARAGALRPERRGRREARRRASTRRARGSLGQQVDVTSEAEVQAAVDAAVAQLRRASTCW